MDVVGGPIIWLITTVINLFVFVLIVSVVLSWLVAFDVVNPRNRFVYLVGDFCYRITEPLLKPIRNVMPNMGNIDISPIVLILLLYFAEKILVNLFYRIG